MHVACDVTCDFCLLDGVVFMAWGQWARIKHDVIISVKFARWRHQLDVRLPVFAVNQNAAPGAKSAIYDFHCLDLCTSRSDITELFSIVEWM